MGRKHHKFWQTFSPSKLWQSLQQWDPRQPKAPIPSIQLGQGDQTNRTSALVTWQDLRTLPAKTLYKSQKVLTQRVPKLVLHNPASPKGTPKRKTYLLVPDQSGDCYYPIGRDINTLRQTGGEQNALIEVSGSPTISRHHCTIYKPNSELSFTERAQDNWWKALRRYLSRTIQGEDYLLSDTRGNCNGVFLKNSLWQRLRTGKQATRMEQDTPLRHGNLLFLTKPNAKGVDGTIIKPVTIRFIYPAIWYVREFWGIVRLLLLGSGIVVGSSWFAIATVRTVKLDPLPPIPAPLAIFASNGVTQISGGIATPHQDIATLDEFPPLLLKTLLLSEDKWYYSHPGVNPVSIINAAVVNRLSGETLSGASTITMQLARTLFLEEVNNKTLWGAELETETDENGEPLHPDTLKLTLTRKIREAGLALRLDATYSKDKLLLAYLNSVDLGYRDLTGQQLRGMADASTFYFNQPIADLTLTGDAQDVMKVARIANLIALIKAPRVAYGVCESRLSSDAVDAWLRSQEEQDIPLQEPNPETYVNPVELARDEVVYLMRLRNRLIQGMNARGWISAAVAELAQDISNFIVFENRAGFCERQVPEGDRFAASPIFLNQSIREELQQVLPPHFEAPYENLIIETSLDIEKQTIATQLLKQHREELWRTQGVPHGALLTIDSKTGRIQALIGEVTFPGNNDQEWIADFAANEYLPPGSTFKMFFYADALKAGMPLSQTYPCDTLQLGGEVFTAAAYSKPCNSGMGSVDL
ncbi:MAG: transglycosylase domain-containing protein, partial [Prochlorotrichaceae cyanobacterium]